MELVSLPLQQTKAEEGDEAQWIAAAQADPAAFEPLYLRYHLRIYHYLRTRINNDDDAADLTHQVFYQALKALPRYKQRQVPFIVWLYRIAHHAAVNVSTRTPHLASWDALPETMYPLTGRNVEEQVLHTEALEDLRLYLQQLDPSKRELLALRFGSGLTIPEIAAVVGKSQNAIKKQLSRIIKSLKEQYSHEQ
ncbi:RNA polymerase sigma factor [Dictyobacter vulcani]|uniref:RNA polymerase sigma factor n=1 Tax=Dictyobacter vulcani TaxID=2607529 RepID=A0A5J4KZK0_9CHLR|nr:sigma-70 family RNA polymerase sigma factor [Dictyobacter vulcani]GER91957.1 RNA polymerase sigma factor [Dictyobacter vulcani]